MNIFLRSKRSIGFVLCLVLFTSVIIFAPGTTYAGTLINPETETASLNKISSVPDESEFDGYIVSIKDKEVDEVGDTEIADDLPSTDSEKYYLVDTTNEALALASESSIEYIEPNFRRYPLVETYPPNDPYYSKTSITYGSGSGSVVRTGPIKPYPQMGIDKLWKTGLHGKGVHVAVLDTGYNSHQDMISPNKILLSKEEPGKISQSSEGNDLNGHGTMVTSIIHAGYNNSKNIAGIADEAKLTSINVFIKDGSDLYATTWQIVNAYEYLLKEGNTPDIMNCSYGGPSGTMSEENMLDELTEKGCIVIAANGNDGNLVTAAKNQLSYPAAYECVIGVGATDGDGVISDFSSKNSSVDVSAWGDYVTVLYPSNYTGTAGASGTSFACPVVAGIAACLKEHYPDLDTDLFRELIMTTSQDKGAENWDPSYGYGLIDASEMLNQLMNYEITYITNGGTWIGKMPDQRYSYSKSPTVLPTNIAMNNSIFKGWYLNENLTDGPHTSIAAKTKGDLTFYAKWGSESVISFNTGNNTVIPNKTVSIGALYGTLPELTKTGYSFGGWYLDGGFKNKITDSTTVGAMDLTIFAKWEAVPQEIEFNDRGNSSIRIYYYDQKLTNLPMPVRTGYTFNGWYTANSGGTKVGSSVAVHSDMTLYARWTAKTYTVKFNVNKGKSIKSKSMKMTYDKVMGSLPIPKRSGYNFLGWKSKKNGGTVYSNTKVWNETKGRTLYANWTKKKIVKFNASGGNVASFGKAFTKGKKYGSLPQSKRSGYNFKGWYTKKSGGKKITSKTKATTNKNHTLYAHWTKKR